MPDYISLYFWNHQCYSNTSTNDLISYPLSFCYIVNIPTFRNGKHASTAKEHLDKVVDFFSKIDPILGDLVLKSKPSEDDPTHNSSSNDAAAAHSGKRKSSDAEESSHNGHAKKKANVGSNGSLTLSQREKRGMDNLTAFLEERGGKRFIERLMSFIVIEFKM